MNGKREIWVFPCASFNVLLEIQIQFLRVWDRHLQGRPHSNSNRLGSKVNNVYASLKNLNVALREELRRDMQAISISQNTAAKALYKIPNEFEVAGSGG